MAVRTRKRGKTWSYSFDIEPGGNGKRRMKEKGGFATKADAYTAGVAAYNDWKNGNIGLTTEKITVAQYIASWLEKRKLDLKPTTQSVYSYHAKMITQYLGSIVLQELRPRDVDTLLQSLCNKGLSRQTLAGCKNLLHLALKHAIYPLELISTNAVEAVDIPRRAARQVVKRQVITQDKLNELLNYYPFGTDYHIPIVIAYYTGLRIGEILGLEWNRVNLDTGELIVEQQLHTTAKLGPYISTPKTATSNRTLLLDSKTVKIFKRWKQRQTENEVNCGRSYAYNLKRVDNGKVFSASKCLAEESTDTDLLRLVCTRANGRYIEPTSIINAIRRRGVNFHSFRHTHATQLIENMASPKSVAARLGHKNTSITENLYTHVTKEMKKQTVEIVEKIHQKSVGK